MARTVESNPVGSNPSGWTATEQLAWTGHDGPGRPPGSPARPLWLGLAGVLSLVFAGMVMTDSLCPEHRAWVQVLGAIALIGTATSVVALLRGWAAAPAITLVSASAGVAIGVIVSAHDATQGRVIALAFAATIVGASVLYVRQLLVAHWARRTLTTSEHSTELATSELPTSDPTVDGPVIASSTDASVEVPTNA